MSTGEPLLDAAHLERQTFGDAALAREVLGLFREQAARLSPLVADAGDAKARADAAHALKGSARGIGAARVAAAAQDCEAALRAGADPGAALAALAAAVAATDEAIAERLSRP